MASENDQCRDDNGEPLMDYDQNMKSETAEKPQDHHLLDVEAADDELSPAPVHSESKSKPRRRLVKTSDATATEKEEFQLPDEDTDKDAGRVDVGGSDSGEKKGKELGKENGGGENEKGKKEKVRKLGEKLGDNDEMKEMWETIAGDTSEDGKKNVRTVDGDNFIDDGGVDPGYDYGPERDHYFRSPRVSLQVDKEIDQLFKVGKKKKREKTAGEIGVLVEHVMAELEVVAEEDAKLNRRNKPAINKLKKLPVLIDALSKKPLQQEFLDHGVLALLKTWLEPLPDGSLPNINIRAAILKILSDYPIDLERDDRREQLKKSYLGKVIMFLSKSDEETTANRKLAKDLVDKWSRPIFNKSTRFEDMRNFEDERAAAFKRATVRRPINRDAGMDSEEDDLDLAEVSKHSKSGQSSAQMHVSRPEAMAMDFAVRPKSKVDPEEARARAKQVMHDQYHLKMNKKLQQLKTSKKQQLQATKISIEGRGMVKYL